MKAKFVRTLAVLLVVVACSVLVLSACDGWEKQFDLTYPDVTAEGWEQTLNTNFGAINNIDELRQAGWAPSPHGKRKTEYWCPEALDFSSDEYLTIKSFQTDNHVCDGDCPASGIFTSGVETRENNEYLFSQAFGLFECEVMVPTGGGMWSAFWLQSNTMGNVGNEGKDGSEIDIYESAFLKNPTKTGACIHYDGYDKDHREKGYTANTGTNLYEGYHKYALLWSPESYVFFVDNKVVWATDFGGVSRVAEFLRLTVEIRGDVVGPYGQQLGAFENHSDGKNDFRIKSVKVYQRESYRSEIKTIADFA